MNDYRVVKQMTMDDVYIFLLPLAENLKFINMDLIPRGQRYEISRYNFLHDSQKRFLGRSFCYDFIKSRYGIHDFELGYTKYKKPFLKNTPEIQFSFSYANDWVLIGISEGRRLGVDIEYVNEMMDVREMVNSIMCHEEYEKFSSYEADSKEQKLFFFKLFSTKESIVKAFGTGLYYNLQLINTLKKNNIFYESMNFKYVDLDVSFTNYTPCVCYEELTKK